MRVDKWLWSARFYKTRALAADAVTGGKVNVNGERAKPAKLVKLGDELHLRRPPYEYVLTVRGVSERRGPAKAAQLLYEESAASIAARARLAAELRLMPPPLFKGRPTKKDRREMDRFASTQVDED